MGINNQYYDALCIYSGRSRCTCLECSRDKINKLETELRITRQQVEVQHAAMRTEWKDLVSERDQYRKAIESALEELLPGDPETCIARMKLRAALEVKGE